MFNSSWKTLSFTTKIWPSRCFEIFLEKKLRFLKHRIWCSYGDLMTFIRGSFLGEYIKTIVVNLVSLLLTWAGTHTLIMKTFLVEIFRGITNNIVQRIKVPIKNFFSKRDHIGKKQFLCSVSLINVFSTMLMSYNMGGVTFLFPRLDVKKNASKKNILKKSQEVFIAFYEAKNTFGPIF